MRKRTIEKLRKQLEERLKELTQHYNEELKRSREVRDDGAEDNADYAFSSYTKEFLLSLSNMERKELHLVEDALRRIDAGGFGVCEECEEPIAEKRLQAVPWARYCISCKELEEKGMLTSSRGEESD